MSLHRLLDDVARTAPTADAGRSAARAWGTAARRRRRARLSAGVAVVGVLVTAFLVGTSVNRPVAQQLPANGELAPGQGIPAQIYSVKPWLPTIGSDPIPPIAYIVEEAYLDRPVAISTDGSYRYLPGPPGDEGYTLSSYAVSHDGQHVAVAWSGVGEAWTGPPVHAQIWAYDVTSGGRRGPWLGKGFGGEITDLVFRTDNEGFAWQESRTINGEPDAATEVVVVAMYWDHYRQDVVGAEGPVAWSPDGSELLVNQLDGEARVVSLPQGRSRVLDVPIGTEFGAAAWSPEGSVVAGLDASYQEPRLVIADSQTGRATPVPLGDIEPRSIVGWRQERVVVALEEGRRVVVRALDPEVGLDGSAPLTTSTGARAVESLIAAEGVLDAAAVVEAPPPDQSRLSWIYLRTRPVELTLIAMTVGGLVVLTALGVTRRRRRRPDPSRSAP